MIHWRPIGDDHEWWLWYSKCHFSNLRNLIFFICGKRWLAKIKIFHNQIHILNRLTIFTFKYILLMVTNRNKSVTDCSLFNVVPNIQLGRAAYHGRQLQPQKWFMLHAHLLWNNQYCHSHSMTKLIILTPVCVFMTNNDVDNDIDNTCPRCYFHNIIRKRLKVKKKGGGGLYIGFPLW